MSAVTLDSTVSILQHIVCEQVDPTPVNIANVINDAFVTSVSDFSPLSPKVRLANDSEATFSFTEQLVLQKLLALNPTRPDGIPCWLLKEDADIFARNKATGPDGIPCWLLKENAGIFARPVDY